MLVYLVSDTVSFCVGLFLFNCFVWSFWYFVFSVLFVDFVKMMTGKIGKEHRRVSLLDTSLNETQTHTEKRTNLLTDCLVSYLNTPIIPNKHDPGANRWKLERCER